MAETVTKPINGIWLLVNLEKGLMLVGFGIFAYAFSHFLITPMYGQKRTHIPNPYAFVGLLVGYLLITLAITVRLPRLSEKIRHQTFRRSLEGNDAKTVMQKYGDRIMWLVHNDEELKIIREKQGCNDVETRAAFRGLISVISIENVENSKPSKPPSPAHSAQTIEEADQAQGDEPSKDERIPEGPPESDSGEDNSDTWSGRPNSEASCNDIHDEAVSIANDEITPRPVQNATQFKTTPNYATTRNSAITSAFTDGSTDSPSKTTSKEKKTKRTKEAARKAAQKKRKRTKKKEGQSGIGGEADARNGTAATSASNSGPHYNTRWKFGSF